MQRFEARIEGNAVRQMLVEDEPVPQRIRFQGQWEDAETGLYYNRFRYYDPDSARYVSSDPISLSGGINTYRYAPNPIGWVDPLGLPPCRDQIMKVVGERMEKHKPAIQALDPNAFSGYRGSLARGFKGLHKKNAPFDPNDFDIDAFIVSDQLSSEIKLNRNKKRLGTNHPGIKKIEDSINRDLKKHPCTKNIRERLQFHVNTSAENAEQVSGGDVQIHF